MMGYWFRRLSWAGHDFLDSIRSPDAFGPKPRRGHLRPAVHDHARPELRLSTAEFSLPRDEPVFGTKLTEIHAIRTINFFVNE